MTQQQPAPSSTTATAQPETKKDVVKGVVPEEELSEEDLTLKNELALLVQVLIENNSNLHKNALETLRDRIRTATTSMTSVPKPLKFLGPHYNTLKEVHARWSVSENKHFLSDILSVLAMTHGAEGKRETLAYRLSGSKETVGAWGHEYVRHLTMELGHEYAARTEVADAEKPQDLIQLALAVVPFFLKHNADADACDLLLEMDLLSELPPFVDKETYARVCRYLLGCVHYVAYPDDIEILKTVHSIYKSQEKHTMAMSVAVQLNDLEIIKADFAACHDEVTKKQLAFMLARQQIRLETDDVTLQEIFNNQRLSENFIALARELEVLEPKTPDDIYKTHLEITRAGQTTAVDSARQNLASTFVNAFVNAAFGKDKLMLTEETNNTWIYKNKGHGMMSATASLGALLLWDVEAGLAQIDKYLYSEDNFIKAGALLAIGLVSSGVRNESDPALALLSEYVDNANTEIRIGAIMGLGLAYAGSQREDVQNLLLPLVSDTSLDMEISAIAGLALGHIYVGSCHGDITSTILQTLMEREESVLKSTYARFLGLGLALLYLGKQEAADATLETLKVIEHPLSKHVRVLVETAAYAGTGNVLKVQEMLHHCNDHLDKEKEDDGHQAFAVLGMALIAMGEDIGGEMSLRLFSHLMHYGEPVIRRTVPLALGLLNSSHPQMTLLDTLSKYSHDHDTEVASSAIFAMGLVGAGTNNARLAQMLRGLASYYYKDPQNLFVVRIAQGLLHMGKGTMTLNPYHFDRSLLSPVGIAGLLTTLVAFTDVNNIIFGKSHYFLYYLVQAMYPRLLLTLDESLKPLSVSVRVGQAVDVVGQAGRPKTITGFQTHSTPVLLAHAERAELATEEYLSASHVLEGFVIVTKNPDYIVDTEMRK